jgi:hypothetical protein
MTDDPEPRLSFDEVFQAAVPPGTDVAAFRAAFREAHRTGGYTPGGRAPDISAPAGPAAEFIRKALPPVPLPEPEDPFSPSDSASVAIAETFHGLVRAGVPVASVERIIGHWLASLPESGEAPDGR